MEFLLNLINQAEPGISLLIFIFGLAAFILSTISGGGGALVLVPVLNWALGVSNTAPVLNLGVFLGRPARLIIFWKHINWKVCLYYAPAAIGGAYLGAWLFYQFRLEWLQMLVGLFLISTIWQYRFGKKERSFTMRLWYFVPLGILVSTLGTIIGAMGPVLNPFYLNLGLEKEELIATKTANSFLMGLSQIGSYTFFGLLDDQYWIYGLILGVGASLGSIIGKRFLSDMSSTSFRRWVIVLMVISGCMLIFKQLQALL